MWKLQYLYTGYWYIPITNSQSTRKLGNIARMIDNKSIVIDMLEHTILSLLD